jgi:uncharacterized protein
MERSDLACFQVVVKETDLFVQADVDLKDQTRDLILTARGYLESHILQYPNFLTTLRPWPDSGPAPEIVRAMIAAGNKTGVGPMAAVAGAVAEFVGRGLRRLSREVMVENGGDVFLALAQTATIGIFAGRSPFSMRIGLRLPCFYPEPIAVCTSSGTIGHSLSLGKADAVSVVARSGALADAAATAIANRIQAPADISGALEFGRAIPGLLGIVAIAGEDLGAWGEVELVPLDGKKG